MSRPTYRKYDTQELGNREHDDDFALKKTMNYESDGTSAIAPITKLTAKKITVDGSDTYVATAPIGSDQADPVWQAKKIAVSGGDTTITWADGDANFDNSATDLKTLTYS